MMLPDPGSLSTKRLILRPLEADDTRGPYSGWMQDDIVTQFLESRFSPPDTAAIDTFVAQMNASTVNYLLGIFRREGMVHIGNVRLGPLDGHHARGVIGILIGDRGSWGQGFASEAINAVCDFAFDHLQIEKLSAGLYAPNDGSRRAFEKAGFHVEAVRKDHAILSGGRVDVIEMARFKRARVEALPDPR